jgi:hypothetical protein
MKVAKAQEKPGSPLRLYFGIVFVLFYTLCPSPLIIAAHHHGSHIYSPFYFLCEDPFAEDIQLYYSRSSSSRYGYPCVFAHPLL